MAFMWNGTLAITLLYENCTIQLDLLKPKNNRSEVLGDCITPVSQPRYDGHRIKEFQGKTPFGIAVDKVKRTIFVSLKDDCKLVSVDMNSDQTKVIRSCTHCDRKWKYWRLDEDAENLCIQTTKGIIGIRNLQFRNTIREITEDMMVLDYPEGTWKERVHCMHFYKSLWMCVDGDGER